MLRSLALALVFPLALALSLGSCTKKGHHDNGDLVGVSQANALIEGIPQNGNSLGDPDAPVVLTEFADLQCPYCAAVAIITLPRVINEYVRTGKARLVFHNFAFLGPDSTRAARMAAAAAEQDKMFQFVEIFLHNQGEPNSGYVTDDFLREVASAVPGLDVDKAFRDRDSAAVIERLEDAAAEADTFNIRATPSFLLGKAGEAPEELEPVTLDPEFFEQNIDELLASEDRDEGEGDSDDEDGEE